MNEEQRNNDVGRTRGAVSRRTFLRAVGASSGTLILAACGASTPATPATTDAATSAAVEPTTAAAEPTTAAEPTVAPAAAEPTPGGFTSAGTKGQITVQYSADSNDMFKMVVDKFTKDTGIGVTYEVSPADYLQTQQGLTTRFASGDTTLDAFHCDDFMAPIYGSAGWLVELDPIIKQYNIDLTDWPTTLIKDVSSWKGKLYRLPWGNDTEIFFYRTDYFKEAGLQPPKTWDELIEAAKKLTKGEEQYGIGLAGQKNGVLGNDIQHWCNQAGGAVNRLDDPGSKQALQFYKDLYATHKVAPASTPQEDYGTLFQGFLDGKFAMWWCWDGFLGAMRTNKEFWKDQVSAFLPPMGPKNAETTTGCWGWAISNGSEKKDLAAQWVEYVSRPEIMKMQIIRGRVPTRMSLWSDPEVQDQAPSSVFLNDLAKAGNLVKARPASPSIQEIYDAAEQNIHAYLTDQVDLDTAVKNAMAKITPVMERDQA